MILGIDFVRERIVTIYTTLIQIPGGHSRDTSQQRKTTSLFSIDSKSFKSRALQM